MLTILRKALTQYLGRLAHATSSIEIYISLSARAETTFGTGSEKGKLPLTSLFIAWDRAMLLNLAVF